MWSTRRQDVLYSAAVAISIIYVWTLLDVEYLEDFFLSEEGEAVMGE